MLCPELAVIAQRERLAEGLRGRVIPARLGRRPEDAVGVFRHDAAIALAVDLGGGRQQQGLPARGGGGEDGVGAAHVAEQRVDGTVDHEADADRRGEVKAGVDPVEQLVDQIPIEHGPLDELHPARSEQVLDVAETARAQVVEDDHVVPVGAQAIAKVGADEPRPPCH